MYQSDKGLEIKLRLAEIDRRFAQLTAVSSKLAGMTAQLDRLREAHNKIGRFTDCSNPSNGLRKDDCCSKSLANGRASRADMLDKH
jgi:hypothetical protein